MHRRNKLEEFQPEPVYDYDKEPLSKRLGRFISLIGIVFAISGGIIVTQRLSEDALALLLGLSCGIAAMLPALVLGGLWLKRETGRRVQSQHIPDHVNSQPSVIVVAPQALPGYNYDHYNQSFLPSGASPQWQSVTAQREFKIVGGSE